jgi:hypothetical protein
MDIVSQIQEIIEKSRYLKRVEFGTSIFLLYSDNNVYRFDKIDKYFRLELTNVVDIQASKHGINYIKSGMVYHLGLDGIGINGCIGAYPTYWW